MDCDISCKSSEAAGYVKLLAVVVCRFLTIRGRSLLPEVNSEEYSFFMKLSYSSSEFPTVVIEGNLDNDN